MKNVRYELYGAGGGLLLPVFSTFIAALYRFGSVSPSALVAAHLGEPLLWIMDTTPLVMYALGIIISRQHGILIRQHDHIAGLESAKRESLDRTAGELASAAQALLGSVSAFTSSTAETAASVRETTATMTQLSHTAMSAALTAETVIGLAQRAERASEDGLGIAERSAGELTRLADEVKGLARGIEALNGRMRDVFELAAVVNLVAERSQRLADQAASEAERAGHLGGFQEVAAEMRLHADDSKRASAQVKAVLAEVNKAMQAATASAQLGGQRAAGGAQVIQQTADTIRKLAAALKDSAQAAKQIARVAQQQENGFEQVLKAMNEIYLATEDNMASTSQVAAGARSLSDLATSLRKSVEA
jgi:methyl-accepting chemotaxis protein